MRAIMVRAPMDFGPVDVPMPACPEGGLLLKVRACGLCGSDLRTLRSGHRKVKLPWIIGHEISGEVVDTGSRYEGRWKAGDLLSVAPLVYCGRCDFCREDRYELCCDYREIAQSWAGGFAEYIAIPEDAIRKGTIRVVPQELPPDVTTIAEPLSSCVHAQERGQIGKGDTVVVMGTGPVGCIHMTLARSRGAVTVIGVDINKWRLDQAADFEPDALIDSSDGNLRDKIFKATNGRGADIVITANPSGQAQVQAVEIARKGGRILLFGGLARDDSRPGIDMNLVHYNALHLIGTTIFAPRHHEKALQLLVSGQIDGNKLITHRGSLEDFCSIAELALEGKVRKAVIQP
jgi:L-iditol 2-dehydrogenase